jgi:dTDP-4-dehydrorhamnose 3,5-epimerase
MGWTIRSAHSASQGARLKFEPVPLAGAFLVHPEFLEDERGMFARSFCQHEFRNFGLEALVAQCNVSLNLRRGTLRGLHFQAAPHEEAKLVRCTRGAIWDVIVDLREGSSTRYRWFAAQLNAQNHAAMYVPRGFAHGFQTLADDTEVFYQMSESYQPQLSRGLRWNDPVLGIGWPIDPPTLSPRDQQHPLIGPS